MPNERVWLSIMKSVLQQQSCAHERLAALRVASLPVVRPVGGSDGYSPLRKPVGKPAGTATGFEHLFTFAQGSQRGNALCRKQAEAELPVVALALLVERIEFIWLIQQVAGRI